MKVNQFYLQEKSMNQLKNHSVHQIRMKMNLHCLDQIHPHFHLLQLHLFLHQLNLHLHLHHHHQQQQQLQVHRLKQQQIIDKLDLETLYSEIVKDLIFSELVVVIMPITPTPIPTIITIETTNLNYFLKY